VPIRVTIEIAMRLPTFAATVLAAALDFSVSAQPVPHSAVVLTDQSVPGLGGATFSGFNPPAVNALGQVAFIGYLQGAGISFTNNTAIFVGSPGALGLAARSGSPAPGLADGTYFSSFTASAPPLNAQGQVAFIANLKGTNVTIANSNSICVGSPGSVGIVARTGDPAPGAGSTFGAFTTDPVLGDASQVAFAAYTAAGPATAGIWSGGPGSLGLVALTGALVPGGGGAAFADVSHYPSINPAGQVAFESHLTGSGINNGNNNNEGIWIGNSTSLSQAVVKGMQAAKVEGGIVYGNVFIGQFAGVTINASGQIAFQQFLSDTPTDFGIWSGPPGDLNLVARSHAPAPVMGNPFSGFGAALLGDGGHVAFEGYLSGAPDVLFAGFPGAPAPIAWTGMAAPGTTNATFLSFDQGGFFLNVNSHGQLAFLATLTGPGVTSANRSGIWASDETGALHLVARTGSAFDIGGGTIRTVYGLSLAGGGGLIEGQPRFFNDAGQLAFLAAFSDFSRGIFIASIPAAMRLSLSPPKIVGGNIQFSFTSASNTTYAIQYKDDLATTNWASFTNITGNGSLIQVQAPLTNGPQRFFRVRQP
jgi:hypothetical protein